MDSLHLWQSRRLHEAFSGRPRPMSSSPAGEQLGHCLRGMFFLPPPPSAGSQQGHMAPEHPCPCHPRPPPPLAGLVLFLCLLLGRFLLRTMSFPRRAELLLVTTVSWTWLSAWPRVLYGVSESMAFGPLGQAEQPRPELGSVCLAGDRSAASEFQPGVPLGGRFSSLAPSRQDVEEATRGATDNSPWGPREQTVLRQPRGRPALCAGTRAINRTHISGRLFGAKRHAPTPPGPRTLPYRAVAERPARGGPGANYG